MIKVNLLPYREEREKLETLGFLLVSTAILTFLMIILFLIWSHQNGQIAAMLDRKISIQKDLDNFQEIIKEANRYKNEVKILERKVQAIDVLRRNQQGPVLLLDQLSRRIAEDAWLISLTQQDSQFTIQGSALTNEGIATFMKNLGRSDYIQEVDLVQSVRTTLMGEEIYNFTITFKWKSAPSVDEKGKEKK